jgi:flavin reductase (DIM6/NTAB) family NADH-FMN oxidoreductase RutF
LSKVNLSLKDFLQANPPSVVVLATCVDTSGRPNIITLGMFMPISFDPPLVCIGVAPKRYSHRLIEETGEFVINVPTEDIIEEVHFCGTKSGRDYDKFQETGLTPKPASRVKPPLIEECYAHLECRVVQRHTCGDHTLFVGEVVAASINEEVLTDDGKVDVLKAKPISQRNHIYYGLRPP